MVLKSQECMGVCPRRIQAAPPLGVHDIGQCFESVAEPTLAPGLTDGGFAVLRVACTWPMPLRRLVGGKQPVAVTKRQLLEAARIEACPLQASTCMRRT